MKAGLYFKILKNGELLPATIEEWTVWFENSEERRVGNTWVGDVQVSTVCLGLDHGWRGRSLWFETVIFGGKHDGYLERYETLVEAKAGHERALKLLKAEEK